MSENRESDELQRKTSDLSHKSAASTNSESPLNVLPEPVQDEEGTTFFLLDVANEVEPVNIEPEVPARSKSKKNKRKKGPDNEAENGNADDHDNDDNSSVSSRSSKSSTDSSSSSVSAQVVIDHGSSIPRRLEKHGAAHLLRSGDDESESDYAFCYTPNRRESDADSVSNHQRRLLALHVDHGSSNLHMMESSPSYSQQNTDLSAAEDDDLDDEEEDGSIHRDLLSRHSTSNSIQNDHHGSDHDDPMNDLNRTRRRHHRHHHRNGKSSARLTRDGDRKEQFADNKAMVTVYTEEDDDLVDEMPRGDRERMMRHNERSYRRHNHDAGFRRRSFPRRLHKRTQQVLQTNLQSQSWSRRESLQSNRHPGLSSEEALG